MKQLWATFCKDLLVLGRDRAGLLVLFLMPAVLVLVVSLVQNNILKTTGVSGLQVLYVDGDGGDLGRGVRDGLAAIPGLELVEHLSSRPLKEATARRMVANGVYQFGILIPRGASRQLKERTRAMAREVLGGDGEAKAENAAKPLSVKVFFDPTVQGVFRTAVTSSLNEVLLGIEAREKAEMLAGALSSSLGRENDAFAKGGTSSGRTKLVRILAGEKLLTVRTGSASAKPELTTPNAVQQNVPAWALFGMFFIVVPLSGALLRERREGTLLRLRTLPVPYGVILIGKIAAFASVCLVQFSLMLLVGKFLLPMLGTPRLALHGQLPAAYLLAFCAALAATGFGLLVGTAARSYEQASMFGAVSVVVAAALGGVMVPVYVMPRTMQAISAFSPLAWGLDGFLEIFVRGGGVGDIVSNLLSLLAFFVFSLAMAWILFRRNTS